ncbi:hypothetical protein ACU4GD_20345 [Cupriavidus basilensis]
MADPMVDVDGLDAGQQLLRDNIRRYLTSAHHAAYPAGGARQEVPA